jgi:hypothetical protein
VAIVEQRECVPVASRDALDEIVRGRGEGAPVRHVEDISTRTNTG